MADRKQNRVRIDAIANAIRKGEYDDKLKNLRDAIDARLDHKRQEVLTLVQEVYGEDYVVTTKRGNAFMGSSASVVPPIELRSGSSLRGGDPLPDDESPPDDVLGADPPIPSGNGGSAADEYESRSPIIG